MYFHPYGRKDIFLHFGKSAIFITRRNKKSLYEKERKILYVKPRVSCISTTPEFVFLAGSPDPPTVDVKDWNEGEHLGDINP